MTEAILTTKLHAPKLPRGWITRERLAKRLDDGAGETLTLVSAPAGFGKSTCVAGWLESRDEASAWLSLDPGDSDTGAFAMYLIAAVRRMFPGACAETQRLLEAADLPPISILARGLASELDAIETPFLLVLDDYHAIGESGVHDLLSEVLVHAPRHLHLIVITRRDPPLPMGSLRGRGQLLELSVQDLQFDRSESDRFLTQSTGLSLSDHSLAHVHRAIEGWPVGLRLVALALANQADPNAFLCDLKGATHEGREYLVEQVLAPIPAVQQHWLLRTAILDRFCPSLCDAVCGASDAALGPELDGKAFLELLQRRGLFAISLDEQARWFRYHHTFQEFLRSRLRGQCSQAEIAALHSRAALWLAENDFPEEALEHALLAGDQELAVELVRDNHSSLINTEQWARLDRWLARIPESVLDEDPALLVAQAWSCEFRGRSCAYEHLRSAEEMLAAGPASGSELEAVRGEADALHAIHEYSFGNIEEALARSQRALVDLHADAHGLRAYASTIEGLALQSQGDIQGCLDYFHAGLEKHSANVAYRSMLFTGLSFAHWLEGDLAAMRRSAHQTLKLGEEGGLRSSIAYARYHLGILHYMRDERADAERNLEAVMDLRFFASQEEYCHAALALALVRLSQGRSDEAREAVESISEHVLQAGNARLLQVVRAFEAEFDVRVGLAARALGWAHAASPDPFRHLYMFYVPQLTLAKVRLAEGSRESRRAATDLLNRLLDRPCVARNAPLRIQALSLRALAHANDDDDTAALAKLTEALRLAAPGGFVRPFVDLGAPMTSLLERLPEAVRGSEIVNRTLAAGAPTGDDRTSAATVLSDGAGALVEPLTNREQDVLELLAERLQDKEIAEKLFIAPVTVKSHSKGLYRKLGVSGRREAVARAQDLGILHSS